MTQHKARTPTLRTITVMFTDLVGSTEMLARVGPEAADRLRERLFALTRAALDHHDGREVKNLGDGTMAVFDSATAAVRCAIALQRAFSDDNRRRRAGDLVVRIGLSTGEANLQQGDVFGVPVIEASRLCDAARGEQILAGELVPILVAARGGIVFEPRDALELKGLPAPVVPAEVAWRPAARASVRIVLADDSVLVREGVARLLEEEGIEVLGQAADAQELLRCVAATQPDAVVTDVRMPPGHALEGLLAAEEIRRRYPGTGVLLLSQHLETAYALRLAQNGVAGLGYLLKERVTDVAEFAARVRRVARGGSAMDPEIVAHLIARATQHTGSLTPEAGRALALAGEGRGPAEIAGTLGRSESAARELLAQALAAIGGEPGPAGVEMTEAVLLRLTSPSCSHHDGAT